MAGKRKANRIKLDNSAIIHMTSKRRDWVNTFRLSITLYEAVDPIVLQAALVSVAPRFPYLFAGVRPGLFWYYLEPAEDCPQTTPDTPAPLTHMDSTEIRDNATRVLYGPNSIAVEIFHSVTDGHGGLVFLKTLVAEYIALRYNIAVSKTHSILRIDEGPKKGELEDSFYTYADGKSARTSAPASFVPSGIKLKNVDVCTGIFSIAELLHVARAHGVTITTLFTAIMLESLQSVQKARKPRAVAWRPIRIMVPVNLRKMFESESLRNFTLYVTPEINPICEEYSFEQLAHTVQQQIDAQNNREFMAAQIGSNVGLEASSFMQAIPLAVKSLGLKVGFYLYGGRKTSMTISNIGQVHFPQEMTPFIKRVDFMLSPRPTTLYNCGIVSFGDKLVFNITKKSKSTDLEDVFFGRLSELGLSIKRESTTNNVWTRATCRIRQPAAD